MHRSHSDRVIHHLISRNSDHLREFARNSLRSTFDRFFRLFVTRAGAFRLSSWTTRELVVSRYMRITRSTIFVAATAALLLFCLVLPGSSQAQGIDGVSQLLGGLGLSGNSGQSNAPVTVERNTPPFTGTFSGKETTGSETKSLDAKLQCYPAHDPAFDKTDTFVCYAAQ